jgi:hypothetical protein
MWQMLIVAGACVCSPGHAITLTDGDARAELSSALLTHRDTVTCRAEVGAPVRILGRSVNLDTPYAYPLLVIRVLSGKCRGFEAVVPERALRNLHTVLPQ